MVQYQTVQVINVTNLIFTAECLSPSALRKVSRRCHGRANCSVLADTQTFGDPCFPGTRKHLRVSFTCGARRTGCCRFWLTWFAASCKKNTTFIFSSVPRYLLEDVGRGSTDPFLISDFTHGESKAEKILGMCTDACRAQGGMCSSYHCWSYLKGHSDVFICCWAQAHL